MKLFSPFQCNSPPHSSLQQHIGDCQVSLALVPWAWQSRDVVRCALKGRCCSVEQDGGRRFQLVFFLSSLITDKGRRGPASGSNRGFSSHSPLSPEKPGKKKVRSWSNYRAWQWFRLNPAGFEQRSASAAIRGDCIPSSLPFQEEKLGRGENGHRRQAWNLVSFYFSKPHVLHLSTSLHSNCIALQLLFKKG